MGGFSASAFAVAAFSAAAFSFNTANFPQSIYSGAGDGGDDRGEAYTARALRIKQQNHTIITLLAAMAAQGAFE